VVDHGALEWTATALTLVGVVRNIKKQRDGFAIWLVANAIWAYVQSHAQVWGMVVCQLVFCLTCFWGGWAWKPRVKDENVRADQRGRAEAHSGGRAVAYSGGRAVANR